MTFSLFKVKNNYQKLKYSAKLFSVLKSLIIRELRNHNKC